MTFSHRTNGLGRRACTVGIAALAAATVAGTLGLTHGTAHAATKTVKELPQEKRYLEGFWANEHVPAYQCPSSHPYLENEYYAPTGTSLIKGVSINEDRSPWPIGVSITGPSTTGAQGHLATGISSDGLFTSATNWTFGKEWYQVVLHCTNDPSQGYHFPERKGGGPL
jgi:hypothetical protein